MAASNTITVTIGQIAEMIDYSQLHPTMTDTDILEALRIAKRYNVATACVKPYLIPLAKKELDGTDVLVCSVIGFPTATAPPTSRCTRRLGLRWDGDRPDQPRCRS